MSDSRAAAGLDRLPWLADEPSPKSPRRSGADATSPLGRGRDAARCRRGILARHAAPRRHGADASRSAQRDCSLAAAAPAVAGSRDRAAAASVTAPPPEGPSSAGSRSARCAEAARDSAVDARGRREQRRRRRTSASRRRSGNGRYADAVAGELRRCPVAPLRPWQPRVVARSRGQAGGDRRVRVACLRRSSVGGTWSARIRRSRICRRGGPARPQFERPALLPFPDRHDLAGPFRSAVPAHAADPLQLRGRRASVEGQGRAVSDHRPPMTTASCRGCRPSRTRTSRAAFRRARCSPRSASCCSPACSSPPPSSGSDAATRR